jgi:quercetin dioxygenase-like cupin family protein
MPSRFEDHRGVIQDLLGPVDSITEIFTKQGAIRGNHVHRETVQYTYIVSGKLLVAYWRDSAKEVSVHAPGELITEPAGVPHAWRALTDTRVLVFTRGPRSGEDYETDTVRLEVPLL